MSNVSKMKMEIEKFQELIEKFEKTADHWKTFATQFA